MPHSKRILGVALLALALNSCTVQENLHPEVHGHRGARGLLPENTIPGFLRAIELGCDMIELDVVLTGDGQVLISHEPWMEPSLCLGPDSLPIPPDQGKAHNIFRMTLEEIRRYDCGSLPQSRFPDQQLSPAYKPTLRELVDVADEHALLSGMASPSFNIEIKSDPSWYGVFQPEPEAYVKAVLSTMDSLGIAFRSIIQSFDPAILEAVRREYPSIRLALLVENKDGLKKNLKRLTFKPDFYSPWFPLVDRKLLEKLRDHDIELLVWTVNEERDIRKMLDLGVDGIISDHPDRVLRMIDERD
jgi:glycerophosphoryl diester phosphodiesterase